MKKKPLDKETFGGGKGSHLNERYGYPWLSFFPLETKLGCLCKRLPSPGLLGLFPASQVFSPDTSQPLPDAMATHDLSWANWMCPLPLVPAQSSLPACPRGSDLYPYALQKTILGMTPQDLREDASNMSESGAWGWTSELCGPVEGDMGFGMGMRTEPQAHFPATFGVGVLARVACGLSRRQRSSWCS